MVLVEQELLILKEHLSSAPVFSEIRVTRSLVLCVMFYRSLLVLFLLTIVLSCSSSLYGSDCLMVSSSSSSYARCSCDLYSNSWRCVFNCLIFSLLCSVLNSIICLFSFWPLYCLSVFKLRLLITSLVSSFFASFHLK